MQSEAKRNEFTKLCGSEEETKEEKESERGNSSTAEVVLIWNSCQLGSLKGSIFLFIFRSFRFTQDSSGASGID